jgi:hypothetical protein
MSAARIVWKRDPEDLARAIAKTGERVKTNALVPYLSRQADTLRAQMKQDAPWADRTGKARRTLLVEVEQDDNRIALVFSHGVEYGRYLELSNGGRYAIIGPTIVKSGPMLMRGMAGLMDRVGDVK